MQDEADEPTSELDYTQAYTRLMAGLKDASVEAHRDGRGGAITALHSVVAFLEEMPQPADGNCTLPLTKLLAALQDLEHGRVSSMLSRRRLTGGAPPDSSLRRSVKGAASAAVDILVERGWRLEEACKFLVELEIAGVRIGGRSKTPDWQVVRGWRQRLSKLPRFDQERHTREAFVGFLSAAIPAASKDEAVKEALALGQEAIVSGWGEKALE